MQGRQLHIILLAVLTLTTIFFESGCATNRGALDITVNSTSNPTSDRVVRIVRVTDKRLFELDPRKPSTPSLKGGEINDKSITLRAIARKRNGFGMAIGDILLPENRSVEDVVREALTKAFREAGYAVIDGAAGPNNNAIPIEADIEQMWSWFTPGFWVISVEFEAKVHIKGDVPSFKEGETIRGYTILHGMGAGTRAWRSVMEKGIEQFTDEVKNRLATK